MRRFRSLVSSCFLLGLSGTALAQDPAPAGDAAPAAPAARPGFLRAPGARAKIAARRAAAAAKAKEAAANAAAPAAAVAAAPAAPVAAAPTDRDPPGAAGPLPSNMDKIAQATDVPFKPKPGGHLVKFNLQDADLAELVNHISGLTGRRFIYGAKVRQVKATVVSPEPVTLEEAYQAFLSILEANGMTVVPHGRFLKIVDSGGVVGAATPLYARGEPVPDSDRYVTRLYRLENVSPDEVMPILTKFKSKEADVSAYNPGKLLIITDTATQVQRLIRIVEEIDVGGVGQHMWIEPVRNGTATDMAKRMNELFELGAPAQPGQPSKSGGLSRVLADEPSNNLIVVGTEDSYMRLLELMKRLDAKNNDGGRVHVLPLQHAIAEEMSNTLSQMLSGGAKNPQQGGSANGMFEGDVKVTADKSTNSLLVNSSNRDYATLRLVIDKLDRARRQVFIEAVIMDLAVSDQSTIGMAFHGGDTLDTGGRNSLLLGGFRAGSSIAFPTDPSLLQGFAAGIRGADLPNTGDILGTGFSIPSFGVVLNALASSGKSNVLATPHIIATDNVAAEISIGDNIPLQTNVGGLPASGLAGLAGNTGAAANPLALLGGLGGLGGFSAPRQDVGNKIKVTPHVNESNQVRLEIDQESSSPGAAVGALGAIPIQKRTANTTVVVQDQQTVVIGGLMKDEYVTSREKVPLLGDIPLLGALFRQTTTTKRKANLLLILTPHVIRDQSDLRRIFERKMQERQEFLDRYFVFSGQDWTPPRDWTRTNGLVEEIRKAYRELEEKARIEDESQAEELGERTPSAPIELPGDVRAGATGGGPAAGAAAAGNAAGAAGAAAAERRNRRLPPARTRQAPAAAPAPAAPAPAPAPAAPAPPPPQGSNDVPFRINPLARNVENERVE
ncbi:MAG TPA: type II secretion system secretin GspD [Polyangiaceae bacterium]|nr:type II secretion system secretin GspD [Polyangiaceae bacterium]